MVLSPTEGRPSLVLTETGSSGMPSRRLRSAASAGSTTFRQKYAGVLDWAGCTLYSPAQKKTRRYIAWEGPRSDLPDTCTQRPTEACCNYSLSEHTREIVLKQRPLLTRPLTKEDLTTPLPSCCSNGLLFAANRSFVFHNLFTLTKLLGIYYTYYVQLLSKFCI